jgi:hypothetical protein
MTSRVVLSALAAWLLSAALPAQAVQFGFACITTDSAANCATGETQLSVDVTEAAGGVLFEFHNSGPNASAITDVYFDDGPLSLLATVVNSGGVLFAVPASPSNLPGGGDISPIFESSFSADSDAPVVANGVNPGEVLGVQFGLSTGASLQDVLDNLESGTLRVGVFVQGFEDQGSESFVNLTSAPEPATVALLALACAWVGAARLRRS